MVLKPPSRGRSEADHPLISVCVINYNGEAFLRDSIGSVLNQTYPRLEIVFCDDASTDSSIALFETLVAESEREISVVRVYSAENRGPEVNALRGLQSFTGDFVCNLDSDDALSPVHLEVLHSVLSETTADIACTNSVRIHSEQHLVPPEPREGTRGADPVMYSSHEVLPTFYLDDEVIPFAYWHRLHHRAAARRVAQLPQALFQNSDSAFSIAQLCEAESVAFLDVPTYVYRVRTQSISHRSTYRYVRDKVYGSLDALSRHYRTAHSELDALNQSRNCRAVAWMLEACVKESLGFREYSSCYREHVTPANRSTVASLLVPNAPLRRALEFFPPLTMPGLYAVQRARLLRDQVKRIVRGHDKG